MNDHAKPSHRLALDEPVVCVEMPDWTTELLSVLVLVIGIFAIVAVAEGEVAIERKRQAEASAERWKARALAIDASPTVRIVPDKPGFECLQFNVRREWTRAVAAKCEELGGLLQLAGSPK